MSDIEKCEALAAEAADALWLKSLQNVVDEELIRLMRNRAHALLDLADAIEAEES